MPVSKRVSKYVCRGCGTCVAVCPSNALTLEVTDGGFRVTCDERACVNCGLCARVCPALVRSIAVQTQNRPVDLIGDYLATYIGFASEENIRRVGTSGGIATQIVLYALSNNLIDGAIVNRFDRTRMTCESFVARNRQEVIAAAGSKYCPSTTNEALSDLTSSREKLALVGLPCQVTGALRAAEVADHFKQIVLRIGLMCSHTITRAGTPFLLEKYALGCDNVKHLRYRAEGWPGALIVEYTTGDRIEIPLAVYWREVFGPYFFTPYGCLLCDDFAAEQADIALGDAWLPHIRARDSIGTSLIVVRSERGMELMRRLHAEKRITVAQIDPSEVVRAQAGIIARKKYGIAGRIRLARMLGLVKQKPEPPLPKSSLSSLVGAAAVYMNVWLSSKPVGRRLLAKVPSSILRRYGTFVYAHSGSY